MPCSVKLMRFCLAAMFAGLPLTLRAEDYPTRPIHLEVGFAPGGVADTIARLYAKELTVRMGQSVIVDNMPSAYNMKPTEMVSRATPDGYYIMLGSSDMLMLPYMKKNYRYRFDRDFTPIASLASSWTVFAVNSDLPVKTLQDFVDYAKARKGAVSYGSGGIGTPMHIAAELLEMQSHIELIHVPYQSGAASLTDLLGGRIAMSSMGLASAKSVEGANLRVLAQAGDRRHPLFPDVPTIAEAGYPDASLEYWFGLFGPAKLPSNVIHVLDATLKDISTDAAFQKLLVQVGMTADFRSSEDFGRYIQEESKRWEQLVPAIGLPQLD
jgi:tripartite-type tricarboxylate transporter receptor subunit TctC